MNLTKIDGHRSKAQALKFPCWIDILCRVKGVGTGRKYTGAGGGGGGKVNGIVFERGRGWCACFTLASNICPFFRHVVDR